MNTKKFLNSNLSKYSAKLFFELEKHLEPITSSLLRECEQLNFPHDNLGLSLESLEAMIHAANDKGSTVTANHSEYGIINKTIEMDTEKTITQIFEESERNNASRPTRNEIESSSNGSVYIDGKELGGYTSYITYNPIVDIVMAKKGVDGWGYRLFMFILSNHDNPSLSNRYQTPVTISVSELASIYNISAPHIHSCIKKLIESKFLILASKGKGKKPSSYFPNVPYIHKLMAEYYKDGKEYFKDK